MTTDEIRDAVVAWFAAQPEEWVPVRRFILQWNSGRTWGGGKVSAGQGRGILRSLVNSGRLQKRVAWDSPVRVERGRPVVHYRVMVPRG